MLNAGIPYILIVGAARFLKRVKVQTIDYRDSRVYCTAECIQIVHILAKPWEMLKIKSSEEQNTHKKQIALANIQSTSRKKTWRVKLSNKF